MSKLMRWRRTNSDENISGLELELSLDGFNWYHYTNPQFNMYRKSELNINGVEVKGASKGFTTMQNCLKLGFKFMPTESEVE